MLQGPCCGRRRGRLESPGLERTSKATPVFLHVINLQLFNTTEAGEEPFPIRVERVGGHFYQDQARTRGRDKAEEVFQSSEIGDLHVLSENPLPCGSFVRIS
jgi:hypothetical protein